MPKTRSKARQTRLEFTPLPSSSPVRQSQPEAVRTRAAAVTLSPSPHSRKKRKITDAFLPTPSSSWQQDGQDDSSRHLRPSSTKSASRTRSFMSQGRMDSSPVAQPSSSREPPAHREVLDLFNDSESDEPVELPSSAKSRAKATYIESDSSSGEMNGDIAAPKNKAPVIDLSDDTSGHETSHGSDESDELPVRRKRVAKELETPRKRNPLEEDDLREDLEFLEPMSPETPRQKRSKSSASKNAKQAALQALKRKREGARTNEQRQVDGGSHGDDTIPDEDAYESEPEMAFHEEDCDKDDENFIEEDDGTGETIPFEFKLRTMKPKQLFKIAVEWMVQKRINPGFEAEDEVYNIAFQRLDDYVTGMGGSKFQSSAWVPRFLRSLKARPVLQENHFFGADLLHDRCDACNRSNHPGTYEVCFQGLPYDRNSLEEFSDDDDDPSRETELPSSNTKYYVGKFCMRNARTAHTLAHWKYHLNDWVVDYLRQADHLASTGIVERDGWSRRKKRDFANSVVDQMAEDGEIQALYRDFKNEIERAQNAQDSHSRHNYSP